MPPSLGSMLVLFVLIWVDVQETARIYAVSGGATLSGVRISLGDVDISNGSGGSGRLWTPIAVLRCEDIEASLLALWEVTWVVPLYLRERGVWVCAMFHGQS